MRSIVKLPQSWQYSPVRRGGGPAAIKMPSASGGHGRHPPGGLGSRQPQSRTLPPWSRLQIIDSPPVQRQRPRQHPAHRDRDVLHAGVLRPARCLYFDEAKIIRR